MKASITFLLMLAMSTILWAQADCPCEQTITVTDATCSDPWGDCVTPSGDYQSTTFTASCTGHYSMNVSVSGCDNCDDYNVCGQLYDSGGGFLGHCYDTGNCSPCYRSCQTLCLYSGQSYTFYVSLESCGQTQCPGALAGQATGVVKYCGPGTTACQ